jgi:ArsR family transcriptional regulator, lead/cadmium/zinc/bismuth-responsive transcriptional repressor
MTTNPSEHALDLDFEQTVLVAQTFAALGDPTRARIVYALTQGEQNVSALAVLTGVSLSAVSHHLARLRGIRLVKARRVGNQVLYSVDDAHVAQLFREALFHLDHVKQGLPDHPASTH